MKILFFSNIPISEDSLTGKNGGGWIASVLMEINKISGHQIAVCYFANSDKTYKYGNISIYNICVNSGGNIIKKIRRFINLFSRNYLKKEEMSWFLCEKKMLEVVKLFNPDVIHVFGSEQKYGLIAGVTDIPIVLHIQGFLGQCYNALLPPSVSYETLLSHCSFLEKIKLSINFRMWDQIVYSEKEILKRNTNYIGRTTWDKRIISVIHPNCNYYNGGEILRNTFYDSGERILPQKLIIVSILSDVAYKGIDMLLKTAKILKEDLNKDFIWKVYGINDTPLIEKVIGLNHYDLSVEYLGRANSEEIKHALLESTCYVHTSYMDNSPNSVCEAQILGVTCVACNVGGVSSIIEDNKTGFLVPANDPCQMAWVLDDLYKRPERNIEIGKNAKEIALVRHDKKNIIEELIKIYENISEL